MLRLDLHSIFKGFRRIRFFTVNFINYYLPTPIYKSVLALRFCVLKASDKARGLQRVQQYAHIAPGTRVDESMSVTVGEYKYPHGKKHKFVTYFFDLYRSVRCFRKDMRFCYLFGDVDHRVTTPTFVKTRPIEPEGAYTDSVLCPLNRVRHLVFVKDRTPWSQKKDMMVSRNFVLCQPHRTLFIERTIGKPHCDVGQVNPCPEHPEYVQPYMSMADQLQYKFVACIEGNDVATNLKWVMSSHSIAVMPRPKIESWFLESRLKPGVHYIEIKDDYSDVEERLTYYLSHPDEAEEIIRNANAYARQFANPTLELWVENQVVARYFQLTGQTDKNP